MRALRHALLPGCLFLGLAGLLLPVGAALAQGTTPAQAGSSQTAPLAGAPVVVSGKTLFSVHARLFTFSAEERAKAVAGKIAWLSKEPLSRIQAISVLDEGNLTEIVSEDTVIMSVTDADARAAGESRQDLARAYMGPIRAAAESLQREYSLKTLLLAVLYTVLATAALFLLFKLFAVVFPKFYARLNTWRGVYIRSIRIQRLELLPAERITMLLQSLARLVRAALTLGLLYLYITLTLGFFPWTRGFSAILLGYVLWPVRTVGHGVLAYLPNLLFLVVILAVAYYIIKFVKFIFAAIGKGTITLPNFFPEWAQPTYKIARFLIIAFTAVVAFPYLPGSKSPAFQGVSIFLGLLFSLGSTSAIANVVAGTVLTYTRAFQVGDRVKIADATGDVIEKTLLVTRIRTIKNEDISMPNALVLGNHIVNYSSAAADKGLILHTTVTIGYNAAWRTVHKLLIDAALSTENILKDPKPFVLQTSLDDSYVSYQLNAYTEKPALMAATYSDLHQNIQDRFNDGGIEIMSPHYRALRDGNSVTIPDEHLPKDYQAPPFRIQPLENRSTSKSDKPE
jgi:small-conductance mechanosensitive channel